MSAVLEELETREQDLAAAQERELVALARRIAKGDELTPEEIEAELAAISRTPKDLQTAVAAQQERRRLIETVSRRPAINKKSEEVAALKTKLIDEFREAERKAKEGLAAIARQETAIALELTTCDRAQHKLLNNPPPELAAQRADHGKRSVANQRRQEYLREAIESSSDEVTRCQQRIKEGYLPEQAAPVIRAAQERIAGYKAELEELENERAELREEDKRIEAAMLLP